MNLRSWQTEFYKILNNSEKNTSMQIYENSIIGGKISSLRVTFSAVVHLIGEIAFDCIAASYLSHHTDSPVDIGWLGVAFPAYLQQHGIIVQLPYIADLAKLEWQRHLVFESHASLPGEIERVFVEHYQYAVDCIWACCQKEYQGDFNVDISPVSTTIVMVRRGLFIMMGRQPEVPAKAH